MTDIKNTKFKKTSLIITSAIVGTLTLATFAPAAFAFGPNSGQGSNQFQQKFNQMHQNAHAQGQLQRGSIKRQIGAFGGARNSGGFLNFTCSSDGAVKLNTMLGKFDEKFELTTEQQDLFDEFKTAALTAQTGFADNCSNPNLDVAKKGDVNIIMRLNVQRHNMDATLKALDAVLPQLEAFYDSLSDEQKTAMKTQGRNMQNTGMQIYGKINN